MRILFNTVDKADKADWLPPWDEVAPYLTGIRAMLLDDRNTKPTERNEPKIYTSICRLAQQDLNALAEMG